MLGPGALDPGDQGTAGRRDDRAPAGVDDGLRDLDRPALHPAHPQGRQHLEDGRRGAGLASRVGAGHRPRTCHSPPHPATAMAFPARNEASFTLCTELL